MSEYDAPFFNYWGLWIMMPSVWLAVLGLFLWPFIGTLRLFGAATVAVWTWGISYLLLIAIFKGDSPVLFWATLPIYIVVFCKIMRWSIIENGVKAAAFVYGLLRSVRSFSRESFGIGRRRRWITMVDDSQSGEPKRVRGMKTDSSGHTGNIVDKTSSSAPDTKTEKGIVQHTADNLRERMKLKFDIRIEEVKTELLRTYRERLEERRRAWEAEAGASQEEKEEIGEQARHERELAQKRREAEKLRYEKEIKQSQKEIDNLDQEKELEAEPSEGEKWEWEWEQKIRKEVFQAEKLWEQLEHLERRMEYLIEKYPDKEQSIRDFFHQTKQEILHKGLDDSGEPEDY